MIPGLLIPSWFWWVPTLVACLTSWLSAAPPDGLPCLLKGEWRSAAYSGPIALRWVDTTGRYESVAGGGAWLTADPETSLMVASTGWLGNMDGNLVGCGASGEDGCFVILDVDYGYGWDLRATLSMVGAGLAVGVAVFFVCSPLRWLVGEVLRLSGRV